MANFLQAIGQARLRPDQAISDYREREEQTALRQASLRRMEVETNLQAEKLKAQQDFNKPVDANVLMQSMSNVGTNGKVTAEYSLGLAKKMGYLNQDGTIKKGHAQEIGNMISNEPFHVKKINEGILASLQQQYNTALQASNELSEKGTDNKQYQEAQARLKQLGIDIHKQRVAIEGSQRMMDSIMKWATPETGEEYAKTGNPDVLLKRTEEKKQTLSPVGKLLSEMNALDKDDPQREVYRKAIEKTVASSGMSVTVDEDGRVRVVTGPGAMMERSTKAALEKDIIGLEQRLADVEEVGKDFSRDFLTWVGQLKGKGLRALSFAGAKLNDDQKAFIANKRRFVEGVEQVFNAYRKEVTGAQAAMQELSMLRDSILNKKLSPDEFEASYNRYVSQLKRSIRLKRMYLRQGISEKEIMAKTGIMNEAYKSGFDVPDEEVNARGDELERKFSNDGLQGDDLQNAVISALRSEGYI